MRNTKSGYLSTWHVHRYERHEDNETSIDSDTRLRWSCGKLETSLKQLHQFGWFVMLLKVSCESSDVHTWKLPGRQIGCTPFQTFNNHAHITNSNPKTIESDTLPPNSWHLCQWCCNGQNVCKMYWNPNVPWKNLSSYTLTIASVSSSECSLSTNDDNQSGKPKFRSTCFIREE